MEKLWQIIETTKSRSQNTDDVVSTFENLLLSCELEEIKLMSQHYLQLMTKLYNYNFFLAMNLIKRGQISYDDGGLLECGNLGSYVEYIIFQGEETYNKVLEDTDNLALIDSDFSEDSTCQPSYCFYSAYRINMKKRPKLKAGTPIPPGWHSKIQDIGEVPLTLEEPSTSLNDLLKKFPQLVSKYIECKSDSKLTLGEIVNDSYNQEYEWIEAEINLPMLTHWGDFYSKFSQLFYKGFDATPECNSNLDQFNCLGQLSEPKQRLYPCMIYAKEIKPGHRKQIQDLVSNWDKIFIKIKQKAHEYFNNRIEWDELKFPPGFELNEDHLRHFFQIYTVHIFENIITFTGGTDLGGALGIGIGIEGENVTVESAHINDSYWT